MMPRLIIMSNNVSLSMLWKGKRQPTMDNESMPYFPPHPLFDLLCRF